MSALLLVLLITPALGQDLPRDSLQTEDPWLSFDKIEHVTFSFLWVLSIQYMAVNKLDLAEREALPISLTGTALMGLLKEVYDARKLNSHFSRRDLAANAVGLCLASAVVLTDMKE